MLKSWTVQNYINLFQARRYLTKKNKKDLGILIDVDIYVQDPLVAKTNQGIDINRIEVTREPDLMDGPTSSRIAVVDYDADKNHLEPAVRWNQKEGRFYIMRDNKAIPLSLHHKNTYQFHQVNVWAIIQRVLELYEETWVLGRSAPWAFEGNRLIVVPHAGYLQNAFYDRRSKSLQFYYFGSGDKRVYTCLSHDIIAHETGHAILDGLRPGYIEDSSLQTTAFHEFVADMTAILSSLRNNQLRQLMGVATGGDLSKESFITALAEEFSQYALGRPYLRSALCKDTLLQLKGNYNPYDWAQVLTATMWQILSELLAARNQELVQRGRKETIPQLMWWALTRFRRVAFQALDYLPPVDVQFSDYAQAVLQADKVAYPADENGYSEIMRKVFEYRGIDLSQAEDLTRRLHFYPYDIEHISRSRTDAYHFIHENRRQLCIPADQDISVVDLYQTDKTLPDGSKMPREIVVQYAWREDVKLAGKKFGRLENQIASLLCGGTLLFDGRGNVLSWMRKPGTGRQERLKTRLRAHCEDERQAGDQRRNQLLDYIAARVERGYIGLYERGRPEEIDTRSAVVAEPRGDGTLRLEVTPHLRHWKES